MADGVYNVVLGRVVELYQRVEGNDPAAAIFSIILLKANEAEATLVDRTDLADALIEAGTTEAVFTNYPATHKALSDTELAALPAPDDGNNRRDLDIPDQTFTSAGNGANDTLTKFLVGYDALGTDVDATIIVMTHHDFAVTTDGSDLTAQINVAGFYRAQG